MKKVNLRQAACLQPLDAVRDAGNAVRKDLDDHLETVGVSGDRLEKGRPGNRAVAGQPVTVGMAVRVLHMHVVQQPCRRP